MRIDQNDLDLTKNQKQLFGGSIWNVAYVTKISGNQANGQNLESQL